MCRRLMYDVQIPHKALVKLIYDESVLRAIAE